MISLTLGVRTALLFRCFPLDGTRCSQPLYHWWSVPPSLWPDVQEPGICLCVTFYVSFPETYTTVVVLNVSLSQPKNKPDKPLQHTSVSSVLYVD